MMFRRFEAVAAQGKSPTIAVIDAWSTINATAQVKKSCYRKTLSCMQVVCDGHYFSNYVVFGYHKYVYYKLHSLSLVNFLHT